MLELKCFLILVCRRSVEFCAARKQTYTLVAHQGGLLQVFWGKCTVITTLPPKLLP
ncbi:hypothetical protein AVDCRST_MAG92-348 [uncultured Coleofasciculus sp.]|uniref:Uncharacterized protein n=1 Tax=uncultured Coleofasciculus sp. TaxID=1267456 RepID=A0A6J4H9N3_9CYAN|nr:hypothetical protein AVDCRST_MAG92-348 [uncultured Coleofasciculus sp.]